MMILLPCETLCCLKLVSEIEIILETRKFLPEISNYVFPFGKVRKRRKEVTKMLRVLSSIIHLLIFDCQEDHLYKSYIKTIIIFL